MSLIHLFIFHSSLIFLYVKLGRVSFFGRYYGNLRLRFVSMRECMRWRDGLISGDNCTQPDVSKYVRSVSNGFLQAFVACLVILKLPQKLVICSDVLGELWSSRRLGSPACSQQSAARSQRRLPREFTFSETFSLPSPREKHPENLGKFSRKTPNIFNEWHDYPESFSLSRL